jgi:hypothetical protein
MTVPPRPIPESTDNPTQGRRSRVNVAATLAVLLVVAAVVAIVLL